MDELIVRLILAELQARASRRVFADNHERIVRVDGRRLMLESGHRGLDVVRGLHAVRVQG